MPLSGLLSMDTVKPGSPLTDFYHNFITHIWQTFHHAKHIMLQISSWETQNMFIECQIASSLN